MKELALYCLKLQSHSFVSLKFINASWDWELPNIFTMKGTLYSLVVLMCIISSCSKNDRAKSHFEGKVWIIDSIKVMSNMSKKGYVLALPNTILKPKQDSTFGLYKDQYVRFKKFYFSEDTLFLSKRYNGLQDKNKPFKYVPYSYKFIDDKCILKSFNNKEEYQTIYLTNLTGIFIGNNDFQDAKLFNSLKTGAWYPIKFQLSDSVLYNNNEPDYYISEGALTVRNGQLNVPHYLDTDSVFVYKLTNENLYIYNTAKKELVQSFRLRIFQENGIDMMLLTGVTGLIGVQIKLKKIDKSLLIDKKDLPKKVRLRCSGVLAEIQLIEFLQENNDYEFYFDIKTLKLTKEDDDNCVYYFNVVRRSKEFYDISSNVTYKVEFLENGKIEFRPL